MTNLKKNPKRLALNLASTTKPSLNKEQTKNDLYQKGPACILPNLYLGSYYNALNRTQLDQLDINCIINVASEINMETHIPNIIDYHHMRWTHSQNNLARVEFAQAISKIQTAHSKKQNVLIHCQQGIERSAALVVAYLLCTSRQLVKITTPNSLAGQNWSLDCALKYVQERAPGIRPNMELLYELREYEKLIIVPTRHNIQTRTRRSESITCCKTTSSLSKSIVNNHQRPRASSFRDHTTSTFLSTCNKKKTPNTIQQNKLATAFLLIILAAAAIHQQQKSHQHQQGDEENSRIDNNSNINHINSSFFLKPVYPIF